MWSKPDREILLGTRVHSGFLLLLCPPQESCSSRCRSERWLGLGGRGGGVLHMLASSFAPRGRETWFLSACMVEFTDVSSNDEEDKWSLDGPLISLFQIKAVWGLVEGIS